MSVTRKIMIIASGFVLITMSTIATASAAPKHDKVQGSGINNPPNGVFAQFHINAKSGPNGEDPQGKFSFKRKDGAPNEKFTAEVTCVNVQGNLASVIGYVTKTKNDPFPAGKYYLVRLKDDGKGEFTMDEIQNGPYVGDPYTCPTPIEPRPEAITKGDIKITDAVAAATSDGDAPLDD